ncbi:hypothetical protein Tpen_1737 [Thermofilum pendens Hrk 5]|uniref:Uncharacterized protein n=2 Tax=Thermofilum pendens TaxID=2269 RepID=A1S102_THEPD|nr:hypothetical protein Tpen_1737 [Thermofilum pendens Hrk 5]
MAYWLGRKFEKINARLDRVEERLGGVEKRLEGVEGRLDKVEERLESVEENLGGVQERLTKAERRLADLEGRLSKVEGRLEALERRVDGVEKALGDVGERLDAVEARLSRVEGRLEGAESRLAGVEHGLEKVESRLSRVVKGFESHQEFLIDYLASEGVIKEKTALVVRAELRSVLSLLSNPLTKEEVEKLREYLEKDPGEFTMEEAEDFLRLARKAVEEHGDKYEVYKLHLYAALVRGWTRRRLAKAEEKGGNRCDS